MSGAVKVGLIGLGEVAQLMHLPLLADDPRFEIVAVTDASPGLTARIAARYRAEALPDAAALIADPAVEAVFILTPDHLHAPLLEVAMRAGKHVFIEKPAALTAAELRPLVDLEAQTPGTVFVGYMRRYAPAFTALKARMPAQDRIRHVRIRDLIRESAFFIAQTRPVLRAGDIPPEVLAEGQARTQALLRSVMGAEASAEEVRAYQVLTGLASHSISAMRDLLGPPLGVAHARQHRGETVIVLFDYGHFTVTYEAVIHEVARFDSGIDVLTDDELYQITYDTPYIRHLPTRLTITRSTETETGTEVVGPFHRDAFQVELDAFHECLRTGQRPRTTLADSLVDLDLFAEIGAQFRRSAGPRHPDH